MAAPHWPTPARSVAQLAGLSDGISCAHSAHAGHASHHASDSADAHTYAGNATLLRSSEEEHLLPRHLAVVAGGGVGRLDRVQRVAVRLRRRLQAVRGVAPQARRLRNVPRLVEAPVVDLAGAAVDRPLFAQQLAGGGVARVDLIRVGAWSASGFRVGVGAGVAVRSGPDRGAEREIAPRTCCIGTWRPKGTSARGSGSAPRRAARRP